jgi:hypothetical protein
MNYIGFSTGSIAFSDYKKAIDILSTHRDSLNAIELSALRENELEPLLSDYNSLDLSSYKYISFHAPSKLHLLDEEKLISLLYELYKRDLNIIVHPDIIQSFPLWEKLGEKLLIENMDRRKTIGRTFKELDHIFSNLPKASLCFDIAHSRQVDPTMYEAKQVLTVYRNRLKQVHISEVNSRSTHERMSYETMNAFVKVSQLISKDVPIIIESPVNESEVLFEVENVLNVFNNEIQEFA